jgi:hypothetical protein
LNPGILGIVFFFLCLDPNLSGDPLLDGTPLLVEIFSERNEFPSELSGLNSDPSLYDMRLLTTVPPPVTRSLLTPRIDSFLARCCECAHLDL